MYNNSYTINSESVNIYRPTIYCNSAKFSRFDFMRYW